MPHRRVLGTALDGHTGPVTAVAFAPDGHTPATGSSDDTVILWDITDPTQARQLEPQLKKHTNGVRTLAFSPDGHVLATGSGGCTRTSCGTCRR